VIVRYPTSIVYSPIISGEGESQTLVFRVPEESGTHYCVVHPSTMVGDYTVAMNATA
jgi:hypothetical protein